MVVSSKSITGSEKERGQSTWLLVIFTEDIYKNSPPGNLSVFNPKQLEFPSAVED